MKKILLWSALTLAVSAPAFAETAPDTTPPIAPPAGAAPAATPQEAVPATPVTPPPTEQQITQPINCEYKIPAKTAAVDQSTVSTWAKNAVTQSFTFNTGSVDGQLGALKNCFTDQGWQAFNDALQKSGNLDAIKSQQLTVTSQVQGEPTFVESKDNQWKISMPLQVVYQNSKEKISQNLNVTVMIARKPSGDLGILQMLALPLESQNKQEPVVVPANTH